MKKLTQTRRDFLATSATLLGSSSLAAKEMAAIVETGGGGGPSAMDPPQDLSVVTINGLEIRIDGNTGTLFSLVYPKVGTILQARLPLARLLDLAYPIDDFPPLRLASRFSRARIEKEAGGVTITWDPLGPSRSGYALPGGKVVAQVSIRPADDGRSTILTCHVENHSQAPIPQVIFPDLGGLQPFAGVEGTRLRFGRGAVQPFETPLKAPDSVPAYYERGCPQYPPSGYYELNTLRWLDYGGLQGGLSVFQKKWGTRDAPTVMTFRTEADPNSLRLSWEHQVTIAPGQTWDSGEFWLTPHLGGWAKGIEVYRSYVGKVNPPRPLPVHVRDGIGFQTIWLAEEFERDPAHMYFRFTDFPRVAEDALKHGITEIVPWGAYTALPIQLRNEVGSEQEFLEGIRRAKEIGVNIAPFASFQTAWFASTMKRYGVEPKAVDNWTYHTEFIPMFRPYYSRVFAGGWIDSGNRNWKQDISEELKKWIGRGLYSFSWDQFSNRTANDSDAGFIGLIQQIRSLARAKDPESTFSGESITRQSLEEDGSVLDYTWNWVEYVDAGPILNVLRSPRLNCNVEESVVVVKKGFCDGLYLNLIIKKPDLPNGSGLISERPELAAALKQVAGLRKQFLQFFVDGTFLGDSVLSEPAPAFVRGHELDGKLLVFVLNDQVQSQYVSVRSNLDWWLPSAGSYQVKSYSEDGRLLTTSSTLGTNWVGVTGLLKPSELVAFEIEAE